MNTTENKQVIAYALIDNISGALVASKKDLNDLKKIALEIQNEKFNDMPFLIYEIDQKNGKNILGKKIN